MRVGRGHRHPAGHLPGAREQGPSRRFQPGRLAPGDGLGGRDGAPVGRQDGPGGRTALRPPFRSRSFPPAYSPDGQWVASAGDDRTVRVWRARGRQDVAVLHGHTGRVIDLAFTPDGRRLASLSCPSGHVSAADNTVRVWDVDPQATLPVLRGHTSYVYPVAYSPDGRWLASGSWDNTVRLWDAATGEPCATLPHPLSFVWDLAFGPDGTWLVTGYADDDRLRIWDVATARVRKEIAFHDRHFHSLTVSPDGTRVAATVCDPKLSSQASPGRVGHCVRQVALLDRRRVPGVQPRWPLAGRPGCG